MSVPTWMFSNFLSLLLSCSWYLALSLLYYNICLLFLKVTSITYLYFLFLISHIICCWFYFSLQIFLKSYCAVAYIHVSISFTYMFQFTSKSICLVFNFSFLPFSLLYQFFLPPAFQRSACFFLCVFIPFFN